MMICQLERLTRMSEDLQDLLEFEKNLWSQGFEYIAGVDEVGRGCLFGDVVAAAVILPQGLIIEGINDSKKLTEKKRELLFTQITEQAISYSIARVPANIIDELNIKQASRLAMKLAVEGLNVTPQQLLIDAEQIDSPIPQQGIVKGDARSQSIGAASILAKVTRDRLCENEWEEQYPQYGIAKHKGYGTKAHNAAILEHGPSIMHRKTFLKKLLGESLDEVWPKEQLLTK